MLKRWRSRLAGGAAAVLVLAALCLGAPLVYLKMNETRMVFEAARSQRWSGLPAPPPAGMRALTIGELHGYTALPAAGHALGYWILHLHGNADSVFSPTQLRNMQRLTEQGFAVLAVDYRGFGPSPGQPTEQGMYEDAAAAWQWLIAQGVTPAHIIIWGHSLGSAPAVRLATQQRAAALVLFGAFTSIPDVAAQRYPWLPVRWLVGVRMDSLRRIAHVRSPVVIAHCLTDQVVPYSHAGRLFAAAPEPKRLLSLTAPSDDGFGGHVTSLYEQLDRLMPLLHELAGVP
jgi:uncharacterized protein